MGRSVQLSWFWKQAHVWIDDDGLVSTLYSVLQSANSQKPVGLLLTSGQTLKQTFAQGAEEPQDSRQQTTPARSQTSLLSPGVALASLSYNHPQATSALLRPFHVFSTFCPHWQRGRWRLPGVSVRLRQPHGSHPLGQDAASRLRL